MGWLSPKFSHVNSFTLKKTSEACKKIKNGTNLNSKLSKSGKLIIFTMFITLLMVIIFLMIYGIQSMSKRIKFANKTLCSDTYQK